LAGPNYTLARGPHASPVARAESDTPRAPTPSKESHQMIPIERQLAIAEAHARRNDHSLGAWHPVAAHNSAPDGAGSAYQANYARWGAKAYARRLILHYGDTAITPCAGVNRLPYGEAPMSSASAIAASSGRTRPAAHALSKAAGPSTARREAM